MNDDIKTLLETMDWPEARVDLSERIMARIEEDATPAPWMLLATPMARFGMALCMAACLLAGILSAPDFSEARPQGHGQWPTTSSALAYMLPS